MLVVAIDLRGHGDSTGSEGRPCIDSRPSEAELLNSLLDLETATKFVRDNGAHPENLALMGKAWARTWRSDIPCNHRIYRLS